MKAPLYLLDAHAVIYRAYFAFLNRPLKAPDGRNVSAVYGFFRILFTIFDERKPARFACVFDPRGKTFRHELYPEYKATRQKAPEDLHPQADMVEEILRALGVPILRREGFEADDLIATLADSCRREGRECWIISADKDLLQLVGDGVKVLRPEKEGYTEIGPERVAEEWGVPPGRILDYLSLTGDSSDNVPGVAGVGDKTAVKLLNQYGSLDAVFASLESVSPPGLKKKLADGKDMAYFSRDLVTLRRDLDLGDMIPEALEAGSLRSAHAASLFLSYGMKTLASRCADAGLFDQADAAPTARPDASRVEKSSATAGPPAMPAPIEVPERLTGPGRYAAVTKPEELEAWVERIKRAGRFAFDTETDGLDDLSARVVGFSLAVEPKEACYVPLRAASGEAVMDEAQAKRIMGPLLADEGLTLVGQNCKYDLHVMETWGLGVRCRLEDSMIAAWLLEPGRSTYALGALAERFLGYKGIEFDDIVPKGSTFDLVPLDKAVPYACEDADLALRLMELFAGRLRQEGVEGVFRDMEMPLVPILASMERAGILLDSSALREYSAELERDLAAIQEEIYRLVGHPFNIASPKQLQEVLFEERKLKSGKKTKTGFSTDVSVLEELAAEDPVPERILRHRSLAKLKGTYVDALPALADASGRVHTHFVQTGAATGRLSSRDPNLQNIPVREEEGRRIRRAFVAAPGMTLVSCDYSQIELVVLAHLSGDPALREAFESGADVHRRTASLLFGVSEDMVSPDQRRIAKTINFGVIYGMSAFRLSNELGIPRKDAADFIDAYFRTYRGVNDFILSTVAEAERTGRSRTIAGRFRPIDGINSRNKTEKAGAERIAVNSPIQGSAADIMKRAMIAVSGALARELPRARLLLQVHDELIIECPRADADRVMALAKAEMEAAAGLSLPLRVSVECARSWGEMH